jgi:hypothetical protein
VVNIHKSLGNDDRLRHHLWEILHKIAEGSSKHGDGGNRFMNNLFQWQQLSISLPNCFIFSLRHFVNFTLLNFVMADTL